MNTVGRSLQQNTISTDGGGLQGVAVARGLEGEVKPAKTAGEATRAHRALTGQVRAKEPVPHLTIVGNQHPSERPASPSGMLVAKAFSIDLAGDPERALEVYETALSALRAELVDARRDNLTMGGIDPDWFRAGARPTVVAQVLSAGGALAALTPASQTAKMALNRMALAIKHLADLSGDFWQYNDAIAKYGLALRIDPSYGAAHYNLACAALKCGDRDGALASLAQAMNSTTGTVDFKQLAREHDVDWNVLRFDAEFRALVGLPPLPASETPQATVVSRYQAETVGALHQGLSNAAFKADRLGNFKLAQGLYGETWGALRRDMIEKHGPELQAQGIDVDAFLECNEVETKRALSDSGILEKDPGVRSFVAQLFNRVGLAFKHEADRSGVKGDYGDAAMMCQLALEVDPEFGAARYNIACIAVKLGLEVRALSELETATGDISFDFKKQARELDTDWNTLRSDERFRALVR